MFSKIQGYAMAAGGVIIAVGLGFLYALGLGKKVERANQIKASEENQHEFEQSISAGHEAGNAERNQLNDGSVHPDPYDRAQQRKGRDGSL